MSYDYKKISIYTKIYQYLSHLTLHNRMCSSPNYSRILITGQMGEKKEVKNNLWKFIENAKRKSSVTKLWIMTPLARPKTQQHTHTHAEMPSVCVLPNFDATKGQYKL